MNTAGHGLQWKPELFSCLMAAGMFVFAVACRDALSRRLKKCQLMITLGSSSWESPRNRLGKHHADCRQYVGFAEGPLTW